LEIRPAFQLNFLLVTALYRVSGNNVGKSARGIVSWFCLIEKHPGTCRSWKQPM